MAKQSSLIKLEGTIGDLSFYKNRNGNYIARRKGGVSRERLLNDPRYQRTRENMQEFSQAASAAKFLKNAFREIELRSNGGKLHNRLYSAVNRVLKTDPVSPRGERRFELGDIQMMRGFEFSESAVFGEILKKQFEVLEDESSVTVTIEEMAPSKYLISPKGSSHYRFSLIRAAVNFEGQTFKAEIQSSEFLPLDASSAPAEVLTLPIPSQANENYFYALSLEFVEELNGEQYERRDISQNPAVIVAVV